jgi:hypothetical protein
MTSNRIIAVGLLSQSDLDRLGDQFTRSWPVEETPCFNSLLRAIDEADRELWRERDRSAEVARTFPETITMRKGVSR